MYDKHETNTALQKHAHLASLHKDALDHHQMYNEEVELDEKYISHNKPMGKDIGMGDTRTPKELKKQVTALDDDTLKSWHKDKPSFLDSIQKKMQHKLTKSEMRKRNIKEDLDEAARDLPTWKLRSLVKNGIGGKENAEDLAKRQKEKKAGAYKTHSSDDALKKDSTDDKDSKKKFYESIREFVEQSLDEGVEVAHDRVMRVHGKKNTFTGHASWMFTNKRYGDVNYDNEKECHQVGATRKDAVKSAKEWAKKHGHNTVYFMESIEQIDELSDKTLDSYKEKASKDSTKHIMDGNFDKAVKRDKGIVSSIVAKHRNAMNKIKKDLTKEEVELDEAALSDVTHHAEMFKSKYSHMQRRDGHKYVGVAGYKKSDEKEQGARKSGMIVKHKTTGHYAVGNINKNTKWHEKVEDAVVDAHKRFKIGHKTVSADKVEVTEK
jgi:predicted RNase H-like HicB family nuclease